MATQHLGQLLVSHPISPGDSTIFLADNGATTGAMSGSTLQSYILTDADVAAVPTIADMASDIAANTAAIAALSSQGGILQSRGAGTAIANTVTATQIDNLAANGTVTMNTGDRLIHVMQFNMVNTSANPVNYNVQCKVYGANTMQWLTMPLAAGTRAVCFYYFEFVQGSTSSNHSQYGFLKVSSDFGSGGSVTGSPSVMYGDGTYWTTAVEYPIAFLSSASDYGTTQQQIETRFTWGTAATTISAQRISSSHSLLRAP